MPIDSHGEASEWRPSEFALQKDRWKSPDDTDPVIILLRHPMAPLVRQQLDAKDESALQEFAHSYLMRVNDLAKLGLPADWLNALAPSASPDPDFGWLPIDNPSREPDHEQERMRDPVTGASFWFEREKIAGEPIDRTLILLGVELSKASKGSPRFSEFGVRVVAHVRPNGAGGDEVRITGMSASLPSGPWSRDEASRPSELLCTIPDRSASSLASISASETLLADAASGEARVFPLNPTLQGKPEDIVYRRPSRTDEMLDQYRVLENIKAKPNGDLQLDARLEILKSNFVRDDLSNDGSPVAGIKNVTLPGNGPPVRSNDFAAVSAFRNLRRWFERFDRYGISSALYFKGADLPIRAVYLSGTRSGSGKDGQAINACVHPEGWKPDQVRGDNPTDRPILTLHLALADLSRRSRKPWDYKNRSPAISLGISSDENWVAHEFGHVIVMASVGELEFRFAHSPGDALAAIIADPFSKLWENNGRRSETISEPEENNGRRGETFTFASTHRRHDRCVLHGWSWSGTLNRWALAPVPNADRLRRKGYWAEQILSSSLFRLYRCLGGDAKDALTGAPNRNTRDAASHYTIYLILRGIGLLGNARLAPANRGEQLMAALVEADIGTGVFNVPKDDLGEAFMRIGGSAHKAIDWAFRAQGMYPAVEDEISNAPGVPNDVDIFIEDQRQTREETRSATVEHDPGTYVPVSPDWGKYEKYANVPGASEPAWFAKQEAVKFVESKNSILVTVGNRGRKPAQNVSVTVWWHEWEVDTDPPPWDRTSPKWRSSGSMSEPSIDSGDKKTFGPFEKPMTDSGRYLVLAEASCGADLPNTDPNTRLSCSLEPTPLPELVVNDNNLGLAVINIP